MKKLNLSFVSYAQQMSVDLLWHSRLSVLCRTCLLQLQLRKYLLLPCSLEQSGCILFGMLECFLSPLGEGELHWMSAELENCPASSSLAVKRQSACVKTRRAGTNDITQPTDVQKKKKRSPCS